MPSFILFFVTLLALFYLEFFFLHGIEKFSTAIDVVLGEAVSLTKIFRHFNNDDNS